MSVRRVIVSTAKAPCAIGPYSQAVIADKTLYVSGQIGMTADKGELVSGGVQAQAKKALENMGEILKAAGASFNSVVKTTVLLADMKDFAAVNEVYGKVFDGPSKPARAAYQAAGLPKGALVEIEAVAVLGDIVDEKIKS